MKRAAAACAIVAALGLLFGSPASATMLRVRLCHGGFLDLPINRNSRPSRDKNCPLGCHAPLCQDRKRRSGLKV